MFFESLESRDCHSGAPMGVGLHVGDPGNVSPLVSLPNRPPGPRMLVSTQHSQVYIDTWDPATFDDAVKGRPSAPLRINVWNRGSAPLAIRGVRLPEGVRTLRALPSEIPVGGNAALVVRYVSPRATIFYGEIRILSNDPLRNSFVVPVSAHVSGGRGLPPQNPPFGTFRGTFQTFTPPFAFGPVMVEERSIVFSPHRNPPGGPREAKVRVSGGRHRLAFETIVVMMENGLSANRGGNRLLIQMRHLVDTLVGSFGTADYVTKFVAFRV